MPRTANTDACHAHLTPVCSLHPSHPSRFPSFNSFDRGPGYAFARGTRGFLAYPDRLALRYNGSVGTRAHLCANGEQMAGSWGRGRDGDGRADTCGPEPATAGSSDDHRGAGPDRRGSGKRQNARADAPHRLPNRVRGKLAQRSRRDVYKQGGKGDARAAGKAHRRPGRCGHGEYISCLLRARPAA